MRAGNMRKRTNDGAVLDRDLLAEYDERLDHYVAAEFGIGAEMDGIRRDQRDAGIERGVAEPLLRHRFCFGELFLGIDAAHLVLLDFDRRPAQAHAARDLDGVG